jgi:hypothetical protein
MIVYQKKSCSWKKKLSVKKFVNKIKVLNNPIKFYFLLCCILLSTGGALAFFEPVSLRLAVLPQDLTLLPLYNKLTYHGLAQRSLTNNDAWFRRC